MKKQRVHTHDSNLNTFVIFEDTPVHSKELLKPEKTVIHDCQSFSAKQRASKAYQTNQNKESVAAKALQAFPRRVNQGQRAPTGPTKGHVRPDRRVMHVGRRGEFNMRAQSAARAFSMQPKGSRSSSAGFYKYVQMNIYTHIILVYIYI